MNNRAYLIAAILEGRASRTRTDYTPAPVYNWIIYRNGKPTGLAVDDEEAVRMLKDPFYAMSGSKTSADPL